MPGNDRSFLGSWGWIIASALFLVAATRIPSVRARSHADLYKICEIQGDTGSSALIGNTVIIRGVVTLDLDTTYRRGFFVQEPDCDALSTTSDAVYVYLGEQIEAVQPGNFVEVSGLVNEYYGLTEIDASAGYWSIISPPGSLPAPVEIIPPFDSTSAQVYLESLEGMLVSLAESAVVGPTNSSNETWIAPAAIHVDRVFQDDPLGTGEVLCLDDGGLFELAGDANVGDRIEGILAVMDYSYTTYRLQLLAEANLVDGSVPGIITNPPESSALRLASFNLHDLFDMVDDPATDDDVPGPVVYARGLEKRALAIHDELEEPALIAVQEAENQAVLEDLLAQSPILADYGIVWADSVDSRGIDNALLYRTDLASILDYALLQGCTSLVDGLGPDGNGDVYHPTNEITCDSNEDGLLDGNRLFERPPLWVHVQICPAGCGVQGATEATVHEMVVIVNHWKSKREDSSSIEYTLPRRTEQGRFVAGLVQVARQSYPSASQVVLGDLNDYPASTPVQILRSAGLAQVNHLIPKETRYTYIFRGVSQELDHILADLRPGLAVQSAAVGHFNADYPNSMEYLVGSSYRSSDHEPLVANLVSLPYLTFLPMIFHTP